MLDGHMCWPVATCWTAQPRPRLSPIFSFLPPPTVLLPFLLLLYNLQASVHSVKLSQRHRSYCLRQKHGIAHCHHHLYSVFSDVCKFHLHKSPQSRQSWLGLLVPVLVRLSCLTKFCKLGGLPATDTCFSQSWRLDI